MTKWEYKVLNWHELPEQGWLNGMGEKGWELVSVAQINNMAANQVKYYFKRPKLED